MKSTRWALMILMPALAGVFGLAACGGGGDEKVQPRPGPARPQNLRKQVPDNFKDVQPPEGMDLTDPAVIARGKELYSSAAEGNCVMCHGEGGKADGPQAHLYPNPPVADLTDPAFHGAASDQYIYWRLKTPAAESSFYLGRSSMTSYPGAQDGSEESERKLWHVVAFVRSLKAE
jgi:mono/diheme cytochrome c family protein